MRRILALLLVALIILPFSEKGRGCDPFIRGGGRRDCV